MAENKAVWGIDIGQAGLKAIRLKYAEAANQALAVAFDYIPHPKILSQPDAIPRDLIRQALATFLERNDVSGDLIAISLPGHSALARFIQLPPVEVSKVSDVVKYEARQQIPFALEDVIWDFQTLSTGMVESDFMLGAEVGLFAMKKEQVYEAIKPFEEAKVEVELVQIAPLAMFNFMCYDQIGVRKEEEFVAPEEYTIMLDMGTDNTTLLVTNGEKIWIRNVPLGGNHFTRALTKDMKLTFAKAEHLKCNATKSPDPRAVFQSLRPVFNDYVAEIQRSIGYFSSVNREAKISKVVGVGNGFKLAGLQKFLQQNLQYEVERVETFNGVIGDTVLNAPLFQENIMSFVVPYGMALQTLELTKIETTLLPPEIAVARKIRRKKPWAVMAASTLLAGLALSTAGYANVRNSVGTEIWQETESAVANFKGEVSGKNTEYENKKGEHAGLVDKGKVLISYEDRRELWIEMHRAVNECLPRAVGDDRDEEDIRKIRRLNILSTKTKRVADLKTWFDGIPESQRNYSLTAEELEKPPTGPGYVVTVVGEHFFTPENKVEGSINFVIDTFLNDLKKPYVQQPETLGEPVPVAILGISHPILVDAPAAQAMLWYPKGPPKQQFGGGRRGFGGAARNQPGEKAAEDPANKPVQIERTTFTIQFAWKPTLPADRVNPEEEKAADGTTAPATDGQPAVPGSPATPGNGKLPGSNPAANPPTGNQIQPGALQQPGVQQPGPAGQGNPGQTQPGQIQPQSGQAGQAPRPGQVQ